MELRRLELPAQREVAAPVRLARAHLVAVHRAFRVGAFHRAGKSDLAVVPKAACWAEELPQAEGQALERRWAGQPAAHQAVTAVAARRQAELARPLEAQPFVAAAAVGLAEPKGAVRPSAAARAETAAESLAGKVAEVPQPAAAQRAVAAEGLPQAEVEVRPDAAVAGAQPGVVAEVALRPAEVEGQQAVAVAEVPRQVAAAEPRDAAAGQLQAEAVVARLSAAVSAPASFVPEDPFRHLPAPAPARQ